MSNCIACFRVENFNLGTNTPEGWWCSRCSRAGSININIAHAPGRPVAAVPGALFMGVLGTLIYTDPEITALNRVVNGAGHDSGLEDIWGLGIHALHQTTPHANVVIVFTRDAGGLRIWGIGAHVARGNDRYRIMRWNGSSGRVQR
jgi:hypothetical protein